jgi:hypothetical protein
MSVMKNSKPLVPERKYLRIPFAVTVGSYFDEWRVAWVVGWDRQHVLFLVVVERIAKPLRNTDGP